MEKSEFLEKLDEFVGQFNALFNSSDYLHKSEFQELLKRYAGILNCFESFKEVISDHAYATLKMLAEDKELKRVDYFNSKCVSQMLAEKQEYLDTLFTKYNLPIVLDKEQKEAVVSDDEASLIIAGAGTGKTTTMTAKVKYLVEQRGVRPDKILVLSYTKKAVGELERQIKDMFSIQGIDVRTFHSLGYRILKDKYQRSFSILSEYEKRKIVFQYVKNIMYKDKVGFQKLINVYQDCFSHGFKETYVNYDSYEEYFEAYKSRKWHKEMRYIESYIENHITKRLCEEKPRGLDGRYQYRSRKEALIANFLYKNGIIFQYEIPAPFKFDDSTPYHPDFAIENHGKSIVIEYYGLMDFNEDGAYSKEQIEDYKKERFDKERELQKHAIDFISLDSHDDVEVIQVLKQELEKRDVVFSPKPNKEIFYDLMDQRPEADIYSFIKEIVYSIDKLKENFTTLDTFPKIIEYYRNQTINEEDWKNKQIEILFIREVYQYYQNILKERNLIDFADMIIEAYRFLKEHPSKSKLANYEYVLIDEYQDISLARFSLIKQVIDCFNSKVIAVGDDWQTIYTFAGSNIELFYKFKDEFPFSKMYQITRTYRNSQELIDIAGNFVLQNDEQIPKKLTSEKTLDNPIEIVYYPKLRGIDVLCSLLDQIYLKTPQDTVYILSRRNSQIEFIISDNRFKKGIGNSVIYKKHKDMKLSILTVHSAKGLTCDQAIVVDLKKNVFPSTRMEKNIFYNYYSVDCEKYPYAEERRLFYVALTRTKNKVYLLAPRDDKSRSIFVDEIKNYPNVLENGSYIDMDDVNPIFLD